MAARSRGKLAGPGRFVRITATDAGGKNPRDIEWRQIGPVETVQATNDDGTPISEDVVNLDRVVGGGAPQRIRRKVASVEKVLDKLEQRGFAATDGPNPP